MKISVCTLVKHPYKKKIEQEIEIPFLPPVGMAIVIELPQFGTVQLTIKSVKYNSITGKIFANTESVDTSKER